MLYHRLILWIIYNGFMEKVSKWECDSRNVHFSFDNENFTTVSHLRILINNK